MEDVAQQAGVSAMTVSRALRRPDSVSPDLRRQVEAAVRASGYVHDLVASALASKHSGMIAVLLPTIASSMFTDTVKGISEVASRHCLQIVLAETNYSLAEEQKVVAALLGRRPDGFVIVGVEHSKQTRVLLERSGLPVVETWDATRRPIDSLVSFSNLEAARAMTAALIHEGYRRIAFVGAREGDRRARMRAEGYRSALAASGFHEPIEFLVDDLTSMAAGAELVPLLLTHQPRPDAVFCLNDVIAAGLILSLQRTGYRVPHDMAVAGFGGFDFARHLNPSLTTVDVPRHELGRLSTELLLGRIARRRETHSVEKIGFEISMRDSTGRERQS
jgi:LacI family gluconate utilization system Gnt-I transcriptional repressor